MRGFINNVGKLSDLFQKAKKAYEMIDVALHCIDYSIQRFKELDEKNNPPGQDHAETAETSEPENVNDDIK